MLPQSVYPSRFQTRRQSEALENPQRRTVSTLPLCLGDKERSHRAVLAGGPSFLKPVACLLSALATVHGWGFLPRQPTVWAAELSFWDRRGHRKCWAWDWPVNNPAPSCQPNPANEFCLTVPRVAVWHGPSELRGQRGCEWGTICCATGACRSINGRGRLQRSASTWCFSCARDPHELWSVITVKTACSELDLSGWPFVKFSSSNYFHLFPVRSQ